VVLHDYALYKSTFTLLYFTSNLECILQASERVYNMKGRL